LISGLLLVCSVGSLLLFLQSRYLPTPPGIDGQALAMYERFTGGVVERSHYWHFSRSFVPAILVLTAALAVWNFRLCRRET
jgi:hypothetical protein